jgi:hypothetical protein
VTRDDRELSATIAGAALAAGLLVAEHLVMYDQRDRYHPTTRYTVGTLALALGHTTTCALLGDARAAARLWAIIAAGGGAVLALYAARGELPEQERLGAYVREAVRDARSFVRRV